MNKVSLIAILLFLMSLQNVEAISLGTLVKKDFASVKANGSAMFELLFWNVEDETYQVELEVEEAPENWTVLIQPRRFSLNSSVGEEYINLPYLDRPARALPVKILVKPEGSEPGEYTILIRAKAGLPSQGITFFQEREFKLMVQAEGSKKISGGNSSLEENQIVLPIKPTEEASDYVLYAIAIICILVVSGLIYKYA